MSRHRAYRDKVRLRFFTEYGTICVCCGEDNIKFLTIHHKDGQGAAHRKTLKPSAHRHGGGGGTPFYAKLLKLPEKDDNLETLCFNCNTAVQFWGSCPHQDQRAE
jgi:5-methylcytosine-specific restriction endonuclease McrA